MPKHIGVTITLGGHQFVAPPLSRGEFKRFKDELVAIEKQSVTGSEALESMYAVVFAALLRNYPELTEAEYDDLADNQTIGAAFQAVMSGSLPPSSGEVRASP